MSDEDKTKTEGKGPKGTLPSTHPISLKANSLMRRLNVTFAEVSNICKQARVACANPSQSKEVDSFRGMYKSLEKYYSKFEDTWGELTDLCETESRLTGFPSDNDLKMCETAKRYYHETNTAYETLFHARQPTTGNTSGQANLSLPDFRASSSLPRIRLPTFDGDLMKWPKFRDIFVSLVHNDPNIPNMEKFHYLSSSLTGPASSVISHLELEEHNYSLAWAAMKDAYNNKRLLAATYLNQILDYRPSSTKPSAQSYQEFIQSVSQSIAAFKLLKIPDESEFILFHLAKNCLDESTREQFEVHNKDEFPTSQQLNHFVRDRLLALKLSKDKVKLDDTPEAKKRAVNKRFNESSRQKTSLLSYDKKDKVKLKNECSFCHKGSHPLVSCFKFRDSTLKERLDYVKSWPGCHNCLNQSHSTSECRSQWRCQVCSAKHHSMLHQNSYSKPKPRFNTNVTPQVPVVTEIPGSNTSSVHSTNLNATFHNTCSSSSNNEVLLGTVVAEMQDTRGCYHTVRMVLDPGSQQSFITVDVQKKLGLEITPSTRQISGIGDTMCKSHIGQVCCIIRPRGNVDLKFNVEAIVLTKITSRLPSQPLSLPLRNKIANFQLADPGFWEPGPVEFLLGAEHFGDVLTGSPIYVGDNLPKIFPSIFGHVLIGKFGNNYIQSKGKALCAFNYLSNDELREELQHFWRIEEVHQPSIPENPDDLSCELHFQSTHTRLACGRYMVRLPFRVPPPDFSNSSKLALKRFNSLERKLHINSELKAKYSEFMYEYEHLGHMAPTSRESKFVIPHHCIVKEESSKLRVVFDASIKTTQGSLNEYLLSGKKLQSDIRDVLLQFRLYKFVFIADIVKMYRQIALHPEDCTFQHVFWRSDPSEPLQKYELKTVTYGLTAAPFLALRVVQQLIQDEGHQFPLASKAIGCGMYVDDLLTGASSVSEILQLRDQCESLLSKGGFTLGKWATNCTPILTSIPEKDRVPMVSFDSKEVAFIKILGLNWNPINDDFSYRINPPPSVETKRSILSTVAKLFDPLGFLSPLTLLLKGFIQELWKLGLDWDQNIPDEIKNSWISIMDSMDLLSTLEIPRYILTSNPYQYQIIGFSDASVKGYCGVLYLRVVTSSGINVSLLTAKSKLAPVKPLSIPRLELCAALLLARLFSSITQFLNNLPTSTLHHYFFTDSTIVLGWLHTPPYKQKTFVANRVVEILDLTPISYWRHVPSTQNPSDVGSRGLTPQELIQCLLWWNGPPWLTESESIWPSSPKDYNILELPEIKPSTTVLVSVDFIEPFMEWMKRFSSFAKLIRTIARLKCYVRYFRAKRSTTTTDLESKFNRQLSLSDISQAKQVCILAIQLKYLLDGNSNNFSSVQRRFIKLAPFLDSNGLIRVGGRLNNANLPESTKHPILLPAKCHFTKILVDHYHKLYCHPSPSLLQAMLQRTYWIPALRRVVRERTFFCLKCFKDKATPVAPRMGDLPSYRVNGGQAFSHVGVDFAGPFTMRESLRRKAPLSKVYLALFVCMMTKSLHLEAVTKLTTEAFLAAFDRFVSRRGFPSDVYSDCGTNFVGAARQLKDVLDWYNDPITKIGIRDYSLVHSFTWHFMPPHTPHMGGVWEGGVKSVKRLMRVIAGDTPLSFEELSTLFTKIEAILNSRPLCPVSNDPESYDYLSPGHFLVGGPLLAVPEKTLLDTKENLLNRWQLIQRMTQTFWHRWRCEYLVTLQQRPKWTKSRANLAVGDLVLLKELGDTSPTFWPTGRVIATHPGKDKIVRVVTIQTKSATLKRPVVKLIKLSPLDYSPHHDPPS